MEREETPIRHVVIAALLGSLAGAGLGTIGLTWFDASAMIVGGTILFSAILGAVASGIMGWIYGPSFVDWLRDNLYWFWV